MRVSIFVIWAIFNGLFFSFGQQQGSGAYKDFVNLATLENFAPSFIYVHALDKVAPQQQEDKITDSLGGFPYRFGVAVEQNLSLSSLPFVKFEKNNAFHSVIGIVSPNATSINLGFKNLELQANDRIYIQNKKGTKLLGPLTKNDCYKGYLGTELLFLDSVYIHIVQELETGLVGELDFITHGYRSTNDIQKSLGASGPCHKNVNCPEGQPWTNIKDGVVSLLVNTNSFCTGSLVANSNFDGKPYVLTANHCFLYAPANWVFKFNYQAIACDNPTTDPVSFSVSGAELRARNASTDFCLVEITGGLIGGQLPVQTNAYFNGMNYNAGDLLSAVGIHHPRGDIKKISFEDDVVKPATSKISGTESHRDGVWRVNWNRGTTTEGKSSGSPLFDSQKRIVGQLWGGGSSCTTPAGFDYYGRVFYSWDLESQSDKQLKHWLDPNGVANGVIEGHRLGSRPGDVDAALVMEYKEPFCSKNENITLKVYNMGMRTLIDFGLEYTFDNWNTRFQITQAVSIAPLSFILVDVPLTAAATGWNDFSVKVIYANDVTDQNTENNQVGQQILVQETSRDANIKLYMDCYASENQWEIKDLSGNLVYKSKGFANTLDKGLHEFDICLPEGCYNFTLFDSYGDGMSFSNDALSCEVGHLTITSGGFVLAELLPENANFGSKWERQICVGPLAVNSLQNEFKIYPNPLQSKVFIESNGSFDGYRLWSTDGRLMQEGKCEKSTKVEISVSLQTGCYLLELVKDTERIHVQTLLVE